MTRTARCLPFATLVALAVLINSAPAQSPRVRFPSDTGFDSGATRVAQAPSPAPPTPLAPITPMPSFGAQPAPVFGAQPAPAFGAPATGAPALGTPPALSPQFGTGAAAPAFTAPPAGAPGATLGQPQFDPYNTWGNAANARPSLLGPSSTTPAPLGAPPAVGAPAYNPAAPRPLFGGAPPANSPPALFGNPPATAPYAGQPPYVAPYGTPPAAVPYANQPLVNPLPPSYYGQPAITPAYPGAPPAATPYYGAPAAGQPGGLQPMYPNGFYNNGAPTGGPPYERLFQNTGARYTWIPASDDPDDLEINEAEVFTTLVWNNFIFTQFPLRMTPGFAVDWLDGPETPNPLIPGGPNPDLPGAVYSAYVEFTWMPQITPQFGAEFVIKPGVFTDFHTFNSNSFRVSALGMGNLQVTPTIALKLGAWYINRNKIKLLPAVGVLWTPSEQVRFDIFFPNPKLSMYLTTVGNTEIWGYLGGEYGGGAWTIERPDFMGGSYSDRVDINDIRVYGGLEWTTARNWKGFVEAGYVFERQIVYVVNPQDSIDVGSAFMLRTGLAF